MGEVDQAKLGRVRGNKVKHNRLKKFKIILKNNQTNAEIRLWRYLKNRQFVGVKFRRQQILRDYIVDFVCFEKKLIIELDGGQHSEQVTYDNERSEILSKEGFKVVLFWNNDVLKNTEGVLGVIKNYLN